MVFGRPVDCLAVYELNIQLNAFMEHRCEQCYGTWFLCGLAVEPLDLCLSEGQKCSDSSREKWLFTDPLIVLTVTFCCTICWWCVTAVQQERKPPEPKDIRSTPILGSPSHRIFIRKDDDGLDSPISGFLNKAEVIMLY